MAQVTEIPVGQIRPDPDQPRRTFNDETLSRLADSLSEVGQLQPVIVRAKDDDYLLVVGERRWRAAQKAGQEKIAACILEEENRSFLRQIQLVENIQREDLNPVERARAIKLFIEERDLSKRAASQKLGVPRTTLTEWLNVMEVDPCYQKEVVDNFNNGDSPLTVSHVSLAVALAAKTGDPTKKNRLLDQVLEHRLSRKETRRVLELFDKYFNLTVEEAVRLVCISRSDIKGAERDEGDQNGSGERKQAGPGLKHLRRMLKLLDEAGGHLTEALENTVDINGEVDESILDDLLVFYSKFEQLIEDVFGLSGEDVRRLAQSRRED